MSTEHQPINQPISQIETRAQQINTDSQQAQQLLISSGTTSFTQRQIINQSIIMNSSTTTLHQPSDDILVSTSDKDKENKKILQNKLKYKKVKQKLNSLCEQMVQLGWLSNSSKQQKDLTSPNKSRLMKLALEFEKGIKTQAKDYIMLQSILKEMLKIIQYKRQHDILILKGARLISSLNSIIKQFPSLHRNEALQSMPMIQLSLRILKIMLSFSSSRYLVLTSNQLLSIISLLSCSLMRQEKNMTISCLSLLNLIIQSSNKVEFKAIINANVEYILLSTVMKRLKVYLEQCLQQNGCSNSQILLLGVKFIYLIIEISCQIQLQQPIYRNNIAENDYSNILVSINNSLFESLSPYFQGFIPFLLHMINQMTYQEEIQPEQKRSRQIQLPNFKINIILYVFKMLNIIFHVDHNNSQSLIGKDEKSIQFYSDLKFIFQYCKENYSESVQIRSLCNEIITFIGNCTYQNNEIQQTIRKQGILQQLCEHPVEYIMDNSLKVILVSTFCTVIFKNKENFKQAFKEYSVQPILQFLQRQIKNYEKNKLLEDEPYYFKNKVKDDKFNGNKGSQLAVLSRKASVSSLNSTYSKASMAESYETQTSYHIGVASKKCRLEYKLQPIYWQEMAKQLKNHDQ